MTLPNGNGLFYYFALAVNDFADLVLLQIHSILQHLSLNRMKTIEALFSRSVRNMASYAPIEPPDQIAARLKLPEDRIIKLDANENPYGTVPAIREALAAGKYYHIYPDPAQVRLRETIAAYAHCSPDHVVAGTGADELIDIACRLVLEPGEKVISFSPTFSYYGHVVALNRGVYETHPREKDYSIDLDRARAIDLDGVKIAILCSPNNPSGNLLEEEVLDYFLSQGILVMLDEAYHEFAGMTFLGKLKHWENLIVLRTFSKCFALAGLRVGYAVTSEKVARGLMRIKPPFSVNVAAEVAIQSCLRQLPLYRTQVDEIIQTRDWVQLRLRSLPSLEVFPSQSNFILCRVIDREAKDLFESLQRRGILVRYFATAELSNFIRVSIGTREQMERFLEELGQLLG